MASCPMVLRNDGSNPSTAVARSINTPTNTAQLSTPPTAAAPSRLSLHTQDLVDVMFELDRCEDPRAQFVFQMAQGGHVHPLDETELKPLRKQSAGIFDPSEWESPILSGLELLPFESLPPTAWIQTTLTSDISDDNRYRFGPSLGSPKQDANAVAKLISNINNPRYSEPGAVIHMQSPTFDRLRSGSLNWDTDGFLGQSNFEMIIAPANEIFELEYYEHYFYSTLLTGCKVWLAFPPLHGNLEVLRKEYNKMYADDSSRVSTDTLTSLQHGIVIIQKPGQTLMIPPYWSVMVFCIETSTSCGYFIATALKYMDRIKNLDLWFAVNRLWPTKEQEQAHLVSYASELANHFDTILKNSFKHFKASQVIVDLCREWEKTVPTDAAYINMKDKVRDLCASIDDRAEAQRIEQVFNHAWIDCLEEKRKKKAECRLCHVRIESMPGDGSPSQRLAQHFIDEHGCY